jgi:hypothetical protein
MNNIKCSECGLVNWATDVECKRCKSLLTVQERRAQQVLKPTDRMAEQLDAFLPQEPPFFSTGLRLLAGLLAFTIVSVVVIRVLGLEHSTLAIGFSLILMLIGVVLLFVSQIWMLVRIFEQSIGWGLGSIFIPIVGLIAIILFWENTKRPFVGQLVCLGIMFFAMQIAVRA